MNEALTIQDSDGKWITLSAQQILDIVHNNAELEAQLQRYKQAPNIPFIKGGACNTTHSACDCVLQRLAKLETELKKAQDMANGNHRVCTRLAKENDVLRKQHEWISVEYGRLDRGLPEIPEGDLINSDLVFVTAGTVESTEISFYNHEEKEWQGDIKHPTHFLNITLPKE